MIRSCIEEGLRFESSNQLGNRRLAADMELGGERLAAGNIHIGIGAANRDPAQFAEPDRFDASREPNRHVAFGSGTHMCLGAVLARLEGTIAISRLVARFDGLHRDGPYERGGRARPAGRDGRSRSRGGVETDQVVHQLGGDERHRAVAARASDLLRAGPARQPPSPLSCLAGSTASRSR